VTAPASKDIGLGAEIGRKAIHLFALVIPLGLLVVPQTPARVLLFTAFAVSVAIDLIRRSDTRLSRFIVRTLGRLLRPHEDNRFSGATYILAAGAICPVAYPLPVAVAALIFIILGDTTAVFVGRYLGRIHIGHKTLEGSLGFFVAAFLGVLWMTQLPMQVRLIGALTAAVVEALPLPIDDNLSAPVVSGLVMTAVFY